MPLPPRRKLLIVLLILVAAGILLWRGLPGLHPAPGELRLSGNIEVTDAEVSFRINGHVLERVVDEGEEVRAGAVIARLESADLERSVARQEAEVEKARALLAELTAGYRPEEIAQAEAALAQVERQ